ncbi:hypothetical protein F1737_07805 [Methanoplanus sp. FWC-SCC4]|uniref:Uncharacterized protein n=1 Tax=Methanochimaera problematica TaxID=2609417 RepID=A0AA97I4K5_9EURY|nr:hypothetical protein [Methanoplanus sp. FWC-SCC4]WOF16604.1 hypothetical protein F1737_07805 [Methanoplanus sp. FWC-SCC4]
MSDTFYSIALRARDQAQVVRKSQFKKSVFYTAAAQKKIKSDNLDRDKKKAGCSGNRIIICV